MKTPSYRIFERYPDIEYYVFSAPITKSSLDLAEEIEEKFRVKVSQQTVNNNKIIMPKNRIKKLKE